MKYLDKNFMFTLSTLTSFQVKYRHGSENIRMTELVKEIKDVFSIDEEELLPILDKWTEYQYTKINNILTDTKYLMYGKKIDPFDTMDSYKSYIESINKILQKD